jgi:hypothetical protein
MASFNNNLRTREDEVRSLLLDEDEEAAITAFESLVAEVFGRQPESPHERHQREVGDEVSELDEAVDPLSESESDADFVAREIESDA